MSIDLLKMSKIYACASKSLSNCLYLYELVVDSFERTISNRYGWDLMFGNLLTFLLLSSELVISIKMPTRTTVIVLFINAKILAVLCHSETYKFENLRTYGQEMTQNRRVDMDYNMSE